MGELSWNAFFSVIERMKQSDEGRQRFGSRVLAPVKEETASTR